MSSWLTNKNNVRDVMCCGLFSLLPPVFSTLLSFFCFVITKRKCFGYFYFIFSTLLFTYLFFSYDTASRFWYSIPSKIDWDTFWTDDFLTLVTMSFRSIGVNFLTVFYFIYLSLFLLWYKVSGRCFDNLPMGLSLGVLICFSVGLRDAIDLTYYTLSLLLSMYFLTKQKVGIIDCVCALLSVFLAHKGGLMIVLPAIALYFILLNGRSLYYWLFLILFFAGTFLFGKLDFASTGYPIIDSMLDMYDIYTSDSFFWGRRNYEIAGIAMFISFYLRTAWFAVVFVLTVIYRHKIKQKFVLAVFQCGTVLLPNFWSYQLFTERTMVAMSFTSILCVIMLIDARVIKLSFIKVLAVIVFSFYSFNILRGTRMPLKNVFAPGSYTSIVSRSIYVPSIVLFDYEDFGFSDKFIEENSIYYND